MTATWKQYEGQAVDGIPLIRLLGGGEASAVYLGELAGSQCAIKLVPADETTAQIPLARWQQASKLSHPHLSKIHQWGRARLNGGCYVYLAMEYGEEVLSAVDRPLTPKEIRELLTPAVNALVYLHAQKFGHGRVHPSNILSVNDVLKMSGDSPLKFGERHAGRLEPSPYDAPELANVGVSALGDVWSLGVTLVEALTKELPWFHDGAPRLPASLKPDSFREVVMGCLDRDPARRWSMTDIAQWLERGMVPMPKKPPRRFLAPAGIAAAVIAVGAVIWSHNSGNSSASATDPAPAASQSAPSQTGAVATQPVAVQKPAGVPAPPPPAAEVVQPPPTPARDAKSKTKQPPRADASIVPPSTPDAAPEKPPETAKSAASAAGDVIPEDVVQAVKPDVPAKSVATIHGKVPIFVRVEADASGAVTEAKVESGKSSVYFAKIAVDAAKQWKFAAGDGPRAWLVRFEFVHDTQRPVILQASRVK